MLTNHLSSTSCFQMILWPYSFEKHDVDPKLELFCRSVWSCLSCRRTMWISHRSLWCLGQLEARLVSYSSLFDSSNLCSSMFFCPQPCPSVLYSVNSLKKVLPEGLIWCGIEVVVPLLEVLWDNVFMSWLVDRQSVTWFGLLPCAAGVLLSSFLCSGRFCKAIQRFKVECDPTTGIRGSHESTLQSGMSYCRCPNLLYQCCRFL